MAFPIPNTIPFPKTLSNFKFQIYSPMASSKLMSSSNSINSETPSSPSSKPDFTTSNFLISGTSNFSIDQTSLADTVATPGTVDDVWRVIVTGDHRECKEEILDEMMTLEDFLVKVGVMDGEEA